MVQESAMTFTLDHKSVATPPLDTVEGETLIFTLPPPEPEPEAGTIVTGTDALNPNVVVPSLEIPLSAAVIVSVLGLGTFSGAVRTPSADIVPTVLLPPGILLTDHVKRLFCT